MTQERNCKTCKYYKYGYCENLELKPCYPSKGCGDFSKREALEQETILDKIRAEIEALEEGIFSYHNDRPWIFKDEVLGIIDKYMAETEGT